MLFVDVAKTLPLSGKVLTEFLVHLIPGKSIVVHQDFYHATSFHLPVVMDFLSEYFSIVDPGRDWSVVFRLETAIPPEKLQLVSLYPFSFDEQQAALRRIMARVGEPWSAYLALSECVAIGTYFGEERCRRALDDLMTPCSACGKSMRLCDASKVWPSGLAECKNFNAAKIRRQLFRTSSVPDPQSKLPWNMTGATSTGNERAG